MTTLDFGDDFGDLLIELADAGADFVVVGGFAVAFHGHPRATKDIDILVRPSVDNSERVFRALAAFGAPIEAFEIGRDAFVGYQGVLQLGLPPNRIDIITRVDGISFDEAIAEGVAVVVSGRRVPVIGVDALLKNKRASGRLRDLADVEALEGMGRGPRRGRR